jgi:hypothetical protein
LTEGKYFCSTVGNGLSCLFSESGKENVELGYQLRLSNSIGLLLKKTNILRDFREGCFGRSLSGANLSMSLNYSRSLNSRNRVLTMNCEPVRSASQDRSIEGQVTVCEEIPKAGSTQLVSTNEVHQFHIAILAALLSAS